MQQKKVKVKTVYTNSTVLKKHKTAINVKVNEYKFWL